MMPAATADQQIADTHEIRRLVQRETAIALWRAVASPVAGAVAAFVERWRAKQAIAQLDTLSDRMLSDIGVARHDIARIVHCGRGAGELSR